MSLVRGQETLALPALRKPDDKSWRSIWWRTKTENFVAFVALCEIVSCGNCRVGCLGREE